MPATLLGTTIGVHGIAADETGLIIHKLDDTSKNQKNWMKNRVGERVARADYDESIEIEIGGAITATSGWGQKLSAVLTIANSISAAHLQSVLTGKTYVDEVKRSRKNDDWNEISISAEMLPFFPSA
ncbi:MAG: hypothetical protein V4819_19185 [Verrucomicrobiota bacterium]